MMTTYTIIGITVTVSTPRCIQFLKIAAFVHGEGNSFECGLALTWLKPAVLASLSFKTDLCMHGLGQS